MRAGEQSVNRAGAEGGQGGDRFDRQMQGCPLMPGQQKTCGRECQPHDDADMQPRHRQDMREPCGDEGVALRRRDGLLVPGQQRDGDGAGFDRQGCQDARGDARAQRLQPPRQRAGMRCGDDGDRGDGKA
jgi:hypothetical protein